MEVATGVQAACDADTATPAQENREKSPSAPWAYFANGPNAAASIAPTLIRH